MISKHLISQNYPLILMIMHNKSFFILINIEDICIELKEENSYYMLFVVEGLELAMCTTLTMVGSNY